jgi:hypothetical protein
MAQRAETRPADPAPSTSVATVDVQKGWSDG